MDLSKDDQYKLVSDLFGGTEYMRENTPRLYALLNATREKHLREGGPHYKTVLQYTEPLEDFVDGIYIDHVIYDAEQKCVLVKATVSLTEQASWIDGIINVDTESGIHIGTHNKTSYDTHFMTIEYRQDGVEIKDIQTNVLVTTFQVSFQTAGSDTLKSQLIQRVIYTNAFNAVEKITIDDPINKNTAEGENIFVTYGRVPVHSEKIDYKYGVLPGSKSLYLDVKGRAFFKGNIVLNGIKDFDIILDCAAGCSKFNNGGCNPSPFEYGFSWNPNRNWNAKIPTPMGEYKNVAFRMRIDFLCEGLTNPFSLYVASDMDDNLLRYPNYHKMPFLTLLWGCLAKGSNIRMADGSMRKIEDICIGEQVLNPFGEGLATVVNTWCGPEKILQHIETGNGRTVDASENHPLWTEKGPKAAVEISEGDMLLAEGGTYDTVVQRYPLAYDGEVFNLELTCDGCADENKAHTMFCNGLVVGDNDLQNRILVCDDEPSPEPISEVMKQEWEAIKRLRKEREDK